MSSAESFTSTADVLRANMVTCEKGRCTLFQRDGFKRGFTEETMTLKQLQGKT